MTDDEPPNPGDIIELLTGTIALVLSVAQLDSQKQRTILSSSPRAVRITAVWAAPGGWNKIDTAIYTVCKEVHHAPPSDMKRSAELPENSHPSE